MAPKRARREKNIVINSQTRITVKESDLFG